MRQVLIDDMQAGVFNDEEKGIIRVSYVELNPVTSEGNSPTARTTRGTNGQNIVRVGVLVAAAGAILIIVAAVAYRRNSQAMAEAEQSTMLVVNPATQMYDESGSDIYSAT